MKVSRSEQNLQIYQFEQYALQRSREERYRAIVERKNFDQIVAERVARNIRSDSNKGRYIDIEC